MSGRARSRARSRRSEIYLWYVVGLLTLAATLSFMDRQILALMIGPVRRDLGISDTQVGLLLGLAFSFFYSAMLLPMAWLADTYSRRAVIGAGIFSWSLMTTLSGVARTYTQLVMARVGVGVGEATLHPAAYSLMADYFPKERLPFVLGVFSTAPFLGIGLANILGGPLVDLLDSLASVDVPLLGTIRPWQLAFFVVGAPGMILALAIFTIDEPRNLHTQKGKAAGRGIPLRAITRFVLERRRFFALHTCGFVCVGTAAWMIFGWVAEFFIRQHGMSAGKIGTTFGVIALTAGLGGSVVAGRIATVMAQRGVIDASLRLVSLSAAAMAVIGTAMPLVKDGGLALLLLIPLIFFMAWPPGLAIVALHVIVPSAIRSRIIAGVLLLTNLLAFTLGPLSVGFFNDTVFRSEAAIGKSLATLACFTYLVAATCFFHSLKPFRVALEIDSSSGNPSI